MKLTKFLKRTAIAAFAVAMIGGLFVATAQPVRAVPYEGENTPGLDSPAFNVYTGVPSIGDESDFFRGKLNGTSGYVDPVNAPCEDGAKFTLRVYVHNGANQNLNEGGSGPGVARNTRVSVDLPDQAGSSFDLDSTIASSNAGSVTDGLEINCSNGKQVKMSYVAGSALQYTIPGGTQALSDDIVNGGGALVGTNGPDGNVWGCWDQRVWVLLEVEVTEEPVVEFAECEAINVDIFDNRRVAIRVNAVAENVTILGYRISTADVVENSQELEYQYQEDGTYKITGEVQVEYQDGTTEWLTSDACMTEVTFKDNEVTNCPIPGKEHLPVDSPKCKKDEQPKVLPNTGIGGIAGLFAAVSATATGAYQYVARRKQ